MHNQEQISAAAERNREPIRAALQDIITAPAHVLEVASGTGQHAAHFCPSLPGIRWQPTDTDPSALSSIRAWRAKTGVDNFLEPFLLDVLDESTWPKAAYDAMFCANMIHISPWEATLGLFRLADRALLPKGRLATYGPYRMNGAHTAPSNERFDAWLKAQDQRWGVRDLEALEAVALEHGLRFTRDTAMPANNFILVFSRG